MRENSTNSAQEQFSEVEKTVQTYFGNFVLAKVSDASSAQLTIRIAVNTSFDDTSDIKEITIDCDGKRIVYTEWHAFCFGAQTEYLSVKDLDTRLSAFWQYVEEKRGTVTVSSVIHAHGPSVMVCRVDWRFDSGKQSKEYRN